jgi:hydroxypyruvate isomerase
MDRKEFMKDTLLAGLGISSWYGLKGNAPASEQIESLESLSEKTFRCDYAIHANMFRHHAGPDFLAQIRFAHNVGFRSIEDNGMRGRPVEMQQQIGQLLRELKMRMGVFVGHTIEWQKPTLTTSDTKIRDQFLQEIKESVEVAKRCGAKWITVVPGTCDNKRNHHFQTAQVIDTLKRAAEILEPHDLVMVLEPLNFRDHPNLFLTDVPQAYLICKAVQSKSCKILYDIYHAQIQVGNIIPYLHEAWDEVAYYQIGDNPGRKEPTTGEINYKNIFKVIHDKGFTGILGMEHGNAQPGKEGELALIKAYREVDAF